MAASTVKRLVLKADLACLSSRVQMKVSERVVDCYCCCFEVESLVRGWVVLRVVRKPSMNKTYARSTLTLSSKASCDWAEKYCVVDTVKSLYSVPFLFKPSKLFDPELWIILDSSGSLVIAGPRPSVTIMWSNSFLKLRSTRFSLCFLVLVSCASLSLALLSSFSCALSSAILGSCLVRVAFER